jgi:hypothetical protein
MASACFSACGQLPVGGVVVCASCVRAGHDASDRCYEAGPRVTGWVGVPGRLCWGLPGRFVAVQPRRPQQAALANPPTHAPKARFSTSVHGLPGSLCAFGRASL